MLLRHHASVQDGCVHQAAACLTDRQTHNAQQPRSSSSSWPLSSASCPPSNKPDLCEASHLLHGHHLWWRVLFTLLPAQGNEGGQAQVTNLDLACMQSMHTTRPSHAAAAAAGGSLGNQSSGTVCALDHPAAAASADVGDNKVACGPHPAEIVLGCPQPPTPTQPPTAAAASAAAACLPGWLVRAGGLLCLHQLLLLLAHRCARSRRSCRSASPRAPLAGSWRAGTPGPSGSGEPCA